MDTRVPDDPGPTSADGGEATRPEDEDGGLHRSAADTVDALLDEVELALARLDDGTYGRCETCGAVIDDAVLAVAERQHRVGDREVLARRDVAW